MTPPLLILVQRLKQQLQLGRSTRESLRLTLSETGSMAPDWLIEWWTQALQGIIPAGSQSHRSPLASSFLDLLQRGIEGYPILESLNMLELEVVNAAEAELESHVSTLPFKMLIPLMAFQFPAYLLLLMGPALRELQNQLVLS